MTGRVVRLFAAAVVIFILAVVIYALVLEPDPGKWPATHLGWMGVASLILSGLGMLMGLFGGDPGPADGDRQAAQTELNVSRTGRQHSISVGGNITAGRDVVNGDKITTVHGNNSSPRE